MRTSSSTLLLICAFLGIFIKESSCFFDPLTIGAVAGISTALYNYKTVLKYTVCKFNECCNDDWEDWEGLRDDLNKHLFGQKLAIDTLYSALKAHSNGYRRTKPLVISIHGTAGTGKTYTSNFIAKWMFKNKGNSKFVHKFVSATFPSRYGNIDDYQIKLNEIVREALLACPRSLFIFEEVDKYQLGIFDRITSYLDNYGRIDGVDLGNAIFIFISNIAGIHVSKKMENLYKNGAARHDLKLSDFEDILEMGSYNLDGGFKLSSLIESKLIDHFIPFLPLEREQVIECIKASFRRYRNPRENEIKEILNAEVVFDSSGMYATAGCKRIDRKVELYVMKRE